MHDGVVIQSPIDEVDEEFVYQRVVNNNISNDYIEDIRVPVFGEEIPFCYLKRRLVRNWQSS